MLPLTHSVSAWTGCANKKVKVKVKSCLTLCESDYSQYSELCLLTEGYWVDCLQIWPSCFHICLQGDFAVPSIKCLLPNLLSRSWTCAYLVKNTQQKWHCASFEPMSPETLYSFSWNPAKPPSKQAQASLLDNDRLIAHIWGCWYFSQKSWFKLVIYPVCMSHELLCI